MDSYIAALEAKLAEASGIQVDQIRKNQFANAQSEANAITEMTAYIKNISVQATAKVTAAAKNPLICSVLGTIKNETGEADKFALPAMGYDYNALEPTICEEIMRIHHSKHHQGYVNNLNNAVTKLAEAEKNGDLAAINQLATAINFNGGGHLNHTIFWSNMGPGAGGLPTGDLLDQINKDFGSFDSFKQEMVAKSSAVKGSGWGWLGWNKNSDPPKLEVATCSNQDPLEATTGLIPLLGIDVWEHAYYIQYKNLRGAYVDKIFDVFNWNNVQERLNKAKSA